MRIAVVTAQFGDPRKEDELVIRGVAGALARDHEVSVLLAGSGKRAEGYDGALQLVSFVDGNPNRARLEALVKTAFGNASHWRPDCDCVFESVRYLAESVPNFVQEEIARAAGGDSGDLFAHLKENGYDVVIFAGYKFASTKFGMALVPPSTRVVLLPLAKDEPLLWMPTYDAVFSRPDRILVTSQTEELILRKRIEGSERARVTNVRFFLNVNQLSADTDPAGTSDGSFLLVGAEILEEGDVERTRSLAKILNLSIKDIKVILLEHKEGGPDMAWLERKRIVSRADYWRWVSRAVALLDPRPRRLLGREVLEAYLFGTPVIVSRTGGANFEHADSGNGGFWFSGISDLEGSVELLRDQDLRDALGQQGKEYALQEYGNPEAFTKRVSDAVLA